MSIFNKYLSTKSVSISIGKAENIAASSTFNDFIEEIVLNGRNTLKDLKPYKDTPLPLETNNGM